MLKTFFKELCCINAPSGSEEAVREYVLNHLPKYTEHRIDPLGNLIVRVNGDKTPQNNVMLDAHMDEVGLIICGITPDGFLKFKTVGGVEPTVLLSRNVMFLNGISGVICTKPVHQLTDDERDGFPQTDELYIDIGAANVKEANELIKPGDTAVFATPYCEMENGRVVSKAIDDRAGCAVLLELINNFRDFSYTVTFTVQEEVGLRGARTAAYSVSPDYAIVVEATTAADIAGVTNEKQVCRLSDGAVVSYMDSATLYDKALYSLALATAENCGIAAQTKQLPTGGNNAGAIHLSRGGIKTVSLSVPCRYIHSPSCVADFGDIQSVYELCRELLIKLSNLKKQ